MEPRADDGDDAALDRGPPVVLDAAMEPRADDGDDVAPHARRADRLHAGRNGAPC